MFKRLRPAQARSSRSVAALITSLSLIIVAAQPAEAWHRHHHHRHLHFGFHLRHMRPGRAETSQFAALVLDGNTGRVLYARDADAERHPASITKVMTLYLLFEQLEKGRISLETPIPMSAHAASQAPSKLGLEPGETISVENAIKAIVTRSANDVAVAVAEAIGGDEENFAQMMTRKAHALGMAHTAYVNASGLPDDRQITTARDLVLLGRAIQERFPRYFRYFSTPSFQYAGETIGNHDHLLGRVEGVDGIKTGYTRASGFNLLTSVHRNGRSLVAVVMGGPTAGARDRFMESLIAQHIASATTIHSATMIADATPPAAAPAPPVRSAALAPAPADKVLPTPPVRVAVAQLSSEDAEGDSDNFEREPPAPTLEATRRLVKQDARPAPPTAVAPAAAPLPPAPPARVAEASPAALGWVKGPEGAAPKVETKAAPPVRAMAALVPTPGPIVHIADAASATADRVEGLDSAAKNQLRVEMQASALTAPAPAPVAHLAEASPAALGWVKGPEGVAQSAQPKAAPPVKPVVATPRAKEETAVVRTADARPAGHEGWMIQIGASEDAGKANELLIRAKTQNRSTLASARPFTEKIEKGNGAFYRARFAGLDSPSAAEFACKNLKRNGFSCFATHD
jgi:D-alanyl-D-alanine carboxypeptidase